MPNRKNATLNNGKTWPSPRKNGQNIQNVRPEYILLAILITITIGARIYYTFQTTEFTDNEAYFHLRQVESIRETGKPLYNDPLSYSGRNYVFSPVYHYVLAGASFLMTIQMAAKIVPTIFAAILIYIVYLSAFEITKNWRAALLAALAAAFTPAFFSKVNSGGPESFVLTLFIITYYFFIKITANVKYAYYFVLSAALLVLTHTASLLLIAGILLGMMMLKIEKIKINKEETEALLFITLLATWFYAIFYKDAFIRHGISIIWQNTPNVLLQEYFSGINIIQAISQIGIIVFIFGIHTIYKTVFGGKKRETYYLTALTLAVAGMMYIKFIKPEFGLMLLGIILTLPFAVYTKNLLASIEKTKIAKYKTYLLIFLVSIASASSIIPSMIYTNQELAKIPSKQEITALKWIEKNTEENAVILAAIDEGHLISGIAKRKNVIDSHFLLARSANEAAEDVNTIFTSPLLTTTVSLLNKYDATYIYISQETEKKYALTHFSDTSCFEKVYDNQAKIYKSLCIVREFEI